MSISLSIFQKSCPDCAANVAVSAKQCACGHDFDSETGTLSPLESTLRDEELYEGYLAARAEQALQALCIAEDALIDHEGDAELQNACTLAREVVKSIDEDLKEQRQKISALRNAMPRSMPSLQMDAEPTVPKTAVDTDRPTAALPELTPSAPVVPVPAITITSTATPVKSSTAAASGSSQAKPAAAIWTAAKQSKAAGVLAALKRAKARETAPPLHQSKAPVPPVRKPVPERKPATPAAAATSSAQRPGNKAANHKSAATAALNASPEAAVTNSIPSVPPPEAFRQEQASKAEKIMDARKMSEDKECPNCTSSVPINTTRCRCGFAFIASGSDIPSLTLCTGDFTALRDSLKLNLR